MKILMLTLNQVNQGTYWRAFGFARELVSRGHQVTLVVTSRKNRLKVSERLEDGVELVETPDVFRGALRSGWDLWNTYSRISWLRGKNYDIIHAFESRPTVIFPALHLKKQGIPLVMDWADWFGKGGSVEERSNPIIRAVLRPVETFFEEHYRTQAEGSTVICSLLYQKALTLGVPKERIRLLRNGADLNGRVRIPVTDARRVIGISNDTPVIGYVGSIFPQDAHLLVKAFDIVAKCLPDVRLVIAGYCPFNIRSVVSQPELVIQTGFLENHQLNEHLSACNLGWLPLKDSNANQGRLPYKLGDYMALGIPVVATAVGDITQIMGNEEIGLLSSDHPEQLAAQTITLLKDPTRMEEMGRRARVLAETHFSWDSLTSDLEKFYQQVLDDLPLIP